MVAESNNSPGTAPGEGAPGDSAVNRRDSTTKRRTAPESRFGLWDLPDRYQVEQELGRGGMGSVYRAYDRVAGHDVALKMLHGFSAEDRIRLKNEFRALANIVHPNLVDLYDLVIDEKSSFFTMELIRGEDFATYIQGLASTIPESERRHAAVRDACLQLALAINALHDGHKLHRDIKPPNVLVTSSGRVVLLDFGVSSATATASRSGPHDFAGTVMYMSPEQLWGGPLTPASDWYSFGATVYEAITGKARQHRGLPTGAGSVQLTPLRKQGYDVPDDIDDLVMALLDDDPEKRPGGNQVLRCLGPGIDVAAAPVSVAPRGDKTELLGRSEALSCLRAALSEVPSRTRVVRLFGPSGIGKTALVRSFIDELSSKPGTLLLESRCHPQEAVVFNALDGFIDELSREIRGCLPSAERRLPTEEYEALNQVFPVLAETLEPESPPSAFAGGRRELRQLAFRALRQLLERIAKRWTIVLWVDDVQWGDEDSGVLLRDLLRGQECPPMLVVLSYREEDEASSRCLGELRAEPELYAECDVLRLEPLTPKDSKTLVSKLLGESWAGDEAVLDGLIGQAGGSPFLLGELARYVTNVKYDQAAAAELRIEEMLRARTEELPPSARRVLEVLAVAGAPLEQQTTLLAAKLQSGERGIITDLERLSILRTTDIKSRRLEFYHHRLREEVVRQLPREDRAQHHHSLAHALLALSSPNPLAAVEHFELAGDEESVRRYVIAAANHALKVLAFERAARLFRRAIELEPGEVPVHELHRRLGTALASAGRGKESGEAFLDAASVLESERGSDAEAVLRLRQNAAEQFIQSGHFEQGLDVNHAVLAAHGVSFPRTRGEALRKAAGLRMLALAAGLRFKTAASPPSVRAMRRFDALWAANARLSMVDYALSSYATARCVRDAVKMGDPSRACWSLGMEAAFSSTLPQPMFQARARKLLACAQELAQRSDAQAYDRIFTTGSRAIISFYTGQFRDAARFADQATEELHQAVPGSRWEDPPWQMWSFLGLSLSGQLKELIKRVRVASEDAARREDRRVGQNVSLGAPAIVWLVLDEPERALERADQALSWSPTDYTVQHYQHYVTCVDAELYLGRAEAAWKRSLDTWPSHKKEFFLSLVFCRDDLLRCRGRAALATALHLRRTKTNATATKHTFDALLKDAARAVRQMQSHQLPCSRGWASLLEAGISRARNRDEAALKQLQHAKAAFEEADTRLYVEVTRYCLGDLAGAAALSERDAAEHWLKEQGVVDPRRLVDTLATGILGTND